MKAKKTQPLTKGYFDKTLDKRFKTFSVELGKFLEEKVIKPIFSLKKDISALKQGLDRVERKVDTALEKTVDHGRKLGDHEDRLQTLEQAKFA
ncbi:hypothetical protein ACFLZP_04795 [Patescibacteria group bacterium]